MTVNAWRAMWVLVVFDVPTTTREARRAYQKYRDELLKENFVQLQLSVYLRHCATLAAAEALVARLRHRIPDDGHVVHFFLTDKQYSMTREFLGKKSTKKKPDLPQQIELF
ncbi:MAG: CRISPR-associated endonuclease Cas2 [Candidatus Micrarchaeaceae archaeon]